jgi:threonine synthase
MNRLICSRCDQAYSLDDPRWSCDCGSYLDIDFRPSFSAHDTANRKPTLWRYREAIPLRDDGSIVSLSEGYTPLTEVDFCGRPVLVKQDHLLPTGSFKDRGASVLISKVKELGITRVVEDSSGNAGRAIAAYCAKGDIGCTILVPEGIRPEKLTRARRYGAEVRIVRGDREATAAAALEAARSAYYAGHSWNPFFLHGTKTFAHEICEQLEWKAPDTIILPVGNGTLLLGTFIGLKELLDARIIDRMPRLIAVQSARCAPLYRAFKNGTEDIPAIERGHTIAEGIAIASPVRARQILKAVRESDGDVIAVNDDQMTDSLKEIRNKGFDIEPTAAAAIAGISKYLSTTRADEIIVSVLTGHGL